MKNCHGEIAANGLAFAVLMLGSVCGYAQTGSAERVARPAGETPSVQYKPLTANQRWRTYLKNSFGPESFLRSGASAAIGQWKDRPKEWGEGGLGYGRRFASSYAQHLTQSTLEFGAASLFREDNRYLPSQQTGFGARTLYAVESPFLARRRDGTRRVSISHIGAIIGAAFIARAWQPHSTRSMRSAELSAVTSFGTAAGFDFVREFWPRKKP